MKNTPGETDQHPDVSSVFFFPEPRPLVYD